MANVPTTALPRFVAIKSVLWKKYLRVTTDKDETLPAGFVKFEEENVRSQYTKFELETPKSTEAKEKDLKHIRCCSNNKYLISYSRRWIVAMGEEQDEETSKSSCSLFKVEKHQSHVAFRNVYTGKLASFQRTAARPYFGGMFLASESLDKDHHCDLFTLVNWEDPDVFSKDDAFKGDNSINMSVLPTAAWPRFVVIKSVFCNKYLRVTADKNEKLPTEFVKFEGQEVLSLAVKFELEMPFSTEAKNKGYLRHIRCCSNNKYLVNNIDKETCRIVAGAEKPEEDTSKSYCTLFQLEDHESNVVIRHVHLGRLACFWRQAAHPFYGGMYLASELPNDNEKSHLYTLLNWEKLVLFPKRVAFKGDDKTYIRLMHFRTGLFELPDNEVTRKLLAFQEFAEKEKNDQAEYEVTTVGDGYVRIKSLANGKFWKRQSGNWIIAANEEETSSDPDTLFEPIKIAGTTNAVVLRNLGNNLFCRRLWESYRKINLLSATSPNITEPLAVLVVEELVGSRQIFDVDFDLSRRRIYNESIISLDERTAENPTDETGRTLQVTQKYTDTKTTSWNTSKSLSFGAKATFNIAKIPVVKWGLDIEVSVDHTATNEWGGSNTSGVEKEATFEVPVPPRTKRTVFVIARQAACEVPFSYTQTDTLPNGKDVTERKHDGVYNGVNILMIDYTTKDEILPKQ